MLILLHIIYIYTEYLWSYIVNRNRLLDEPDENEANCEEYERNTEYGASRVDKKVISSSKEDLLKVNDGTPSDNLESDADESSDRFSFSDTVEDFEDAVYDVDTKKLTFFPPVYVQRYITVVNILKDERWRNEIKKVVDIGCAELGFFKFLKDIESLERIIEIDIDKNLLQQYSYRIQPWVSDYLKDRNSPLEVTLLCGNVTCPDRHLEGVDAVVAIELIEHLFPPDLDALPFNIFGVVKPRIAIFTTPNEEFNVLFDNFSGFRHDDHKFEWNRGEFESWANNICSRFPSYEVNFFGVGPGPRGNDSLGCCSQGCVFIRTFLPKENCITEPLSNYVEYEVIDHVDYPYRRDSRSQDKITFDDAENFINLSVRIGDYSNGDRIEIPLSVIFMRVYKTCKSSKKLKQILEESGYEIEKDKDGDYIVIVPESYFDSEPDNQSEFKEESIQYIDYVEGENALTSDWDNVEQDCVSWVTDDIPNGLKNNYSNQLIGDKESSDYKSEHIVAPYGDIDISDGAGLLNNSRPFDENLKLDINLSEFNSDCHKNLADLSLDKLECNLGKNILNSDDIPQQISNESIGMNSDCDNLKTSHSTSDECRGPLKHSVKFLSSEECMSYDMSEIKRTSSDDSNDVSVLELKNSVLENLDEEEKEIKSVQFNCENLISGHSSVNETSPVSYSIPSKGEGSFHEVNNSKNVDTVNISPPKSNLVQNIYNCDYLGVSNLEVISDSQIDKNPALLLNDNLTESNSSQLSVGDNLKSQIPVFKSEIEHYNCKDSLFSKNSNDEINNKNLSVDSIYVVDDCIEGVQEELRKLKKCSLMRENDISVKNSVIMTSGDLSVCVEKENVCLGMKSLGSNHNVTGCTNSFTSVKSDSAHLNSGGSTTAKNYLSSRNDSGKCIDVSSEDESNHITGLKNKCDKFLAREVLADSSQCDKLDLNKKSNLSDSNSISDNRTNVEKVFFCDFGSPVSSVLDPDEEAASSFMHSECLNFFESDNKCSETAVNDLNGKLCNDFLSMPSNLTPSQSDSSNSNNIRMFDKLINSDALNDKKITSDLSLCIDKDSEKVIKTHNFETDKNESLSDFAADEVHLNSEPNTFNVCEKNYDRMLKSHSLSHFLEHSSPPKDECKRFMNPSKNSSKDVAFFPSSSPADHQKLHQKLAERFDEKKPFNENCQEEDDDNDNDESLKDFLHAGMERQDSFSPDKAGDSGYPNSNSGRDMEMDLTPEQVKEIMTEGESSLENSPPDSPIEEAAVAIIPHPPILHLGDNVENGDVANNNRDGEGNNMIGQAAIVGEPLEFHAVIDQDQEVPLMAVAEFIGRNQEIHNKADNLNNKCSENDSALKNENKGNPEADAQKKEKLNLSTSICVANSSCSVSDDRHGIIKRSKTFLDKPSIFNSIADKGNSETNSISCPDSTLKLIDETEISCVTYSNNLSHSSITNWESFKMVESDDVRELRKYASWLAEKSSNCLRDNPVGFSGSAPERFSVLQADSVPSCSFSNRSFNVSSVPQTDISQFHHPPSVTTVSEARLSWPEVIAAMPFEILDEMLDSVIQDIVEEFLSPDLEPFADWLLQIQLEFIDGEGNDGDRVQNNGNHGLRALDEGNNTSDQVLTVEADVKGGGDSSIDQ